ncbi:MAG: flagellar basal body rod protein FlgB [Gammaproteobacteria bacterium]|nr:MAG: flagellar basal body rod protein FlgB [Gammaproteobacteria bacterium]
MPLDLDSQFALHGRALQVASQRLKLLADNIANADTPGFKARDIDFGTALREAGEQQLPLSVSRPNHLASPANPAAARVQYRVPEQPSLDGNTVDSQKESAAVAETAVRYQATLSFLNARIRGLRLAITGGR